MIALHSVEPLARTAATVLADSVAVGTAVALVAGVLNVVLRDRSAATRFGVLLAALMATASLPLLRLSIDDTGTAFTGVSLLHVAESWAPLIVLGWAALASVGLARIVSGVIGLRRLRQNCRPVANGTVDAALIEAHCPSRPVQLLASAEAAVPAAIGFFRPAVVLPEWLLTEMSVEEIRQVVIHELSHLRRWDDWTNLLQQVVKAVLFFHPAVWWMESRLSLEREMACDDAVLKRSKDARSYAECLARIAERSFLRRGLAMAQAAVSKVRQTSQRVARILNLDQSLPARRGKLSVAITMVVTVAGMGMAWRTPLLFSFDAGRPVTSAGMTAPAVAIRGLQPVKAAWHEPVAAVTPKPRVTRAPHPTVATRHVFSQYEGRAIPASVASSGQGVMRSVVLVVMQDGEPVAVWHITTWQYSPSQQVRSARKTT